MRAEESLAQETPASDVVAGERAFASAVDDRLRGSLISPSR